MELESRGTPERLVANVTVTGGGEVTVLDVGLKVIFPGECSTAVIADEVEEILIHCCNVVYLCREQAL